MSRPVSQTDPDRKSPARSSRRGHASPDRTAEPVAAAEVDEGRVPQAPGGPADAPAGAPATPPRRPERPAIDVRVRDLDRIVEKTPVYLEPAHIAWLFAGLLVVVAAVFVVGYFLGRTGGDEVTRPADLMPPTASTSGSRAGSPAALRTPPSGATRGQVLPPPPEAVARTSETVRPPERRPPEPPPPVPPAPPVPAVEALPAAAAPIPPAPVAVVAAPAAEAFPAPRADPEEPPPAICAPAAPCDEENGKREPAKAAVALPPPPPPIGDGFWPGVLVTDMATCVSCIIADGACGPATIAPIAAAPAPAPAPVVAIAAVPAVEPAPEPVPEPPPAAPVAAAPPPAPAAPAVPAQARPAKPAPPAGTWAVQARAFRDDPSAKAYVAELKGRGYTARVVPFTDGTGTTWFRIRLGRFQALAAAQSFAAKFNLREHENAIAVEVP